MSRFIAFYLPQFHPIKENNEWWGNGFTEWTNVVKARPLFIGHKQPKIPADLGFYDLRLEQTRIDQAELAKSYGIEGFCYWHYWFGNGKQLLERPFNEVVNSGNPDFPFCLAWANHSWEKKQFDKNGTSEVLCQQLYPGEQDYIDHFNAFLPAFKDKRYMKINDKLIFIIYDSNIKEIPHFMSVWRNLAKKEGLNDFYFITRDADSRKKDEKLSMGIDAIYNDDVFNIHHKLGNLRKEFLMIKRKILKRPTIFNYKEAIKYMISEDCKNNNVIPLIAPNWDHSPRSGGNSILLHNPHPRYFKKLVRHALEVVNNKPKEEQIIFIKSWNEWGEGNYLEPDLEFGKGNLEALKQGIEEFTKTSN